MRYLSFPEVMVKNKVMTYPLCGWEKKAYQIILGKQLKVLPTREMLPEKNHIGVSKLGGFFFLV